MPLKVALPVLRSALPFARCEPSLGPGWRPRVGQVDFLRRPAGGDLFIAVVGRRLRLWPGPPALFGPAGDGITN